MQKDTLKITLAQLNPILGDIDGNIKKINDAYISNSTNGSGCDLIVFSEQIVTGYPQEDLVQKPFFLRRVRDAVEAFAKTINGQTALLISAPWQEDEDEKPYNAVLLINNGQIEAVRYKHELPNYGVFDEKRVFQAGPLPAPITFKGFKLGVMTCEDMWLPQVSESLRKHGADILISLNGSPFETDKTDVRHGNAIKRSQENKLPIIYVNQIGGQDELVFDGASFVLDKTGTELTRLKSHAEDIAQTTWEKSDTGLTCTAFPKPAPTQSEHEAIYQTLTLGLRDYVNKNGFKVFYWVCRAVLIARYQRLLRLMLWVLIVCVV